MNGSTDDFIDAYRVLGVSPQASHAELKHAHRRLVRRHHPDLHPPPERAAATRRVQQLNVAYGLVRDPTTRAAYDRARRAHQARTLTADDWQELAYAAGKWAGAWWGATRRRLAPRGAYGAGRRVGRLLRHFS